MKDHFAFRRFSIAPLLHYLLGAGVALFTTLLLLSVRRFISPPSEALLYLLPVGLSTVLWGLGPGIAAAICAFVAYNYFFIRPYYSLLVLRTEDLLALIVFLIVAIVINQLVGRNKSSLSEATAREREAIRLYELSTTLAGLNYSETIVNTLAEKAIETFHGDRIEVMVEAKDGQPPLQVRKEDIPVTGPARIYPTGSSSLPTLLMPLQSGRGLIGEIRVWRNARPFTAAEERLLRTFASQGVLALERARLAQADTRARVLEESDRMKSTLLSSVSHELRTPLATIKAAVTSLRSKAVPLDSEASADLLAAIEEETDHLNQLVGNLLNMSRIEAGVLKPEREWNVLEEIVAGVVNRIRSSAQQHTIEMDIPEELPLVPVDYIQMEQVFTNLISNSLKYSPLNTTIRIEATQLDSEMVLVQLTNQGPHVAEEDLTRIFEKFHRVTASDRITGTGLGLSICKGIIEAHGGNIWAENVPGGFTFKFTLPLSWEGKSQQARRPRMPVE